MLDLEYLAAFLEANGLWDDLQAARGRLSAAAGSPHRGERRDEQCGEPTHEGSEDPITKNYEPQSDGVSPSLESMAEERWSRLLQKERPRRLLQSHAEKSRAR